MTTVLTVVSNPPQSSGPGDVPARLADVNRRIQAAARRAGRDPGDVLLVAVSKQVDSDGIAAALGSGQLDLGESRAQELNRKHALFGATARWHFVGRLQRNKVADVVGVARLIHSIDRLELAEAVAVRARAADLTQQVLVQVNVGGDPRKAGVDIAAAPDLVGRVLQLEGIEVRGLMTVPPRAADPRPSFAALLALRDTLRSRWPEVTELSMGMSGDFEAAVEQGATIVRVGEAVFGSRPSPGDE